MQVSVGVLTTSPTEGKVDQLLTMNVKSKEGLPHNAGRVSWRCLESACVSGSLQIKKHWMKTGRTLSRRSHFNALVESSAS